MHEFGHVLGALHEHQRTDTGIIWNEGLVIDEYNDRGRSTAQDAIECNVVGYPLQGTTLVDKSPYDPPLDHALPHPREVQQQHPRDPQEPLPLEVGQGLDRQILSPPTTEYWCCSLHHHTQPSGGDLPHWSDSGTDQLNLWPCWTGCPSASGLPRRQQLRRRRPTPHRHHLCPCRLSRGCHG